MFTTKTIKEICSHSVDEYPFECCGAVLESVTDGEQMVVRCKNIQNEIHDADPEKNPRDARTAYTIDARDLLKINKMASGGERILKAIYHSHPDHDAYFSDEDYSFAVYNGEPTYPGSEYIIVSIIGKKVKKVVSFSWDSATGKYTGKEASHNLLK